MTDVLLLCNREKEFPDSTSLSSVLRIYWECGFPFFFTDRTEKKKQQHLTSSAWFCRFDRILLVVSTVITEGVWAVYMVVIVSIIRLKPSDVHLNLGLVRRLQMS